MNYQYLAIAILSIITVIFIAISISKELKKLNYPLLDWNSKKIIPTNIREDRNISDDVLIYCYDTKKLHIGYYQYLTDRWVIISNNNVENFVWCYINEY